MPEDYNMKNDLTQFLIDMEDAEMKFQDMENESKPCTQAQIITHSTLESKNTSIPEEIMEDDG